MDCPVEPGSFRDRNGRVYYKDGVVLRGLSQRALAEWELLSSKTFFHELLEQGKIVKTKRVELPQEEASPQLDGWAGFLEHQVVPFISYPYEWCFGMLKDAALLHLELQLAALEEDMTLKDASAFNVQWTGAKPLFIDVPSFEALKPGEPWTGYRQFCEMFLYPLFLQAYKDVSFQPWLRGRLDGIRAEDCRRVMSLRDLARPGVFTHVVLQARMQGRYANTEKDVKSELRRAGFSKDLIRANLRNLSKLVQGLQWKRSRSEWSEYATENSYTSSSREQKAAFVRRAVQSRRWHLVWDLGCNTGTYSRIAAENADYVVAMDADDLAVEQLYQSLKADGTTSILPLVNNLADPSPRLGWRLLERKALEERGRPDLTLCLALIHHLVIGANVPMKEFIDWLKSIGTDLVIEFVTRDDPMVKTLLRNKVDDYTDYDLEYFERVLAQAFQIEEREVLSSGTRIMYFAKHRDE